MQDKEKFTYNQDSIVRCNDISIKTFKNDKYTKIIETNAFKNCVNLKKITLTNNVHVEENAFPEPSIKEIVFGKCDIVYPNTINAKNLEKITFLKTATKINSDIFFNDHVNIAPKLKEIIIEENGLLEDEYAKDFSRDGIWYQTEKDTNETSIIFYPPAKTDKIFKVPSFVDMVDCQTFHFNHFIEKIIFPKNFKGTIDEVAFDNCDNLETIIFQDYIELDEKIFNKCPKLKIVMDINEPCKMCDMDIIPLSDYIFNYAKSLKDINNFYKNINEEER